jgi:hypothetical protein
MHNPQTGLQDLDDDALRALASVTNGNGTMLAEAIREIDKRGLYDARDPGDLLSAFVRARVREAKLEFLELHANLYVDDEDAESEFIEYLRQAIQELSPGDDDENDDEDVEDDEDDEPDELEWPWPVTGVTDGNGRGGSPLFEHERSALKMCGYTVGRDGLPQAERFRLLDYFFRNRLPSAVPQVFGDEYGDPGSEGRLQKMANVIASNCRNFKKNDAHRYRQAIADWECDLALLHARYYKAGSFPWPPTDV